MRTRGREMDLSGSSEVGSSDVTATTVEAPKAKGGKGPKPAPSRAEEPVPGGGAGPKIYPVEVDHSRDSRLTDFGKETLDDRYLLPGETYQDLFVRVASAYADDADHAQRLYDYISRLWFMPATPVLSNGGTGRGLPISCYLNSVP